MTPVEHVIATARAELGVREDPPESNNVRYNTWYYGREVHGKAYPWCMVFVQWCFAQVDVGLPVRTASCSALMNAAKGAGCWVTRSFQPGDVVIYDFTGKKKQAAHCGIVESVTGSGVIAIEGNTGAENDANGGQVQRRKRGRSLVKAYIRPFAYKKEEDTMTGKEIYEALQEYTAKFPLPDWARAELEEAKRLGITDGENPMQLIPRYQAAIMAKRAAAN